jgi:aryl-alcohol dehydrogenase-like predicted oxidoreductase
VETRPLGETGIQVPVLGFGAGHIGGEDLSEAEAGRLLNEVLDLGITLIDTAPGYGRSEERIGRHLAHRRDDFVLVTKCGYGVPGLPDWTPACITAGVDQALRRLQTDHLDVMLFHSCPRWVLDTEGLVAALDAAVRSGKVRAAGYSGENEDLAHALGIASLTVFETSINLSDQRSLMTAVPRAQQRGAGIIAKRPLGNAPWRYPERPVGNYAEVYWERMQAMGLDPGGLDWGEFALRFAAFAPGVGTAIVGSSRIEHLRRNVGAIAKGPLPSDVVENVRERFRTCDRDWVGQI